ncbi:MAG: GAF domain-containing protein [Candidatus Baltobacteraceae bacterium]
MLKRVTVTLPDPLASELEELRLKERISASSVAEVALRAYLSMQRKEDTGNNLRAAGASLRRRQNAPARSASPSQLERDRLEAVQRYKCLDTPPEGAYDAVVSLAASVFGVPIALVTVVDEDRIWLKACHGLHGVSEIPREAGLCSCAVLTDEVYVVESARTDPRTITNALVAGEMGLQFYAAAPLTTKDGFRLGTFCIIDKEPREMSPTDSRMLETFAAIVMNDLELRLDAMAALRAERRRPAI